MNMKLTKQKLIKAVRTHLEEIGFTLLVPSVKVVVQQQVHIMVLPISAKVAAVAAGTAVLVLP